MRYLLLILFSLTLFKSYSQVTRVDSSVVYHSRLIYNSAGYYIGKDSFHTKRVELENCGLTWYEENDTLIERFPMRFITMDSVVGGGCTECGVPIDQLNDSLDTKQDVLVSGTNIKTVNGNSLLGSGNVSITTDLTNYLERNANDTIFGWLYMRDNLSTTPMIKIESAIDPYILDIGANNGILIGKSTGSATTSIFNDHISIERYAEYTPTYDSDVLVQWEIKDLISDSIATRPTIVDVRNEISDSLATFTGGGGDYIRKDQNDTVTTYQTVWKDGANETKVSNMQIIATDGTNTNTLQPNQFYLTDGNNLSGVYAYNNAYIYDDSDASKLDAYSNHLTIDRSGYSATASNEVPIVSEVKALINDSLDTRLALYTPNSDLEEKIQDQIGLKLVEGSNITLTYNDATGETTIDASGGGGGGLTDEQVRDTTVAMFTVGPSITWNEDDAADSVYLDVNTNPLESAVQGLLIGKSLGFAIGGSSGITICGMSFSTTGTANGTTLSSSSPYRARPHKYEYVVSTASTTAVAGYRGSSDEIRQDDGFIYSVTWGPALGVSNTSKRAFAGLRNSPSAPTDVSPSTLVECFGMGWDDANDTNIQIFHNDASGTATKIDLGSGFQIPTADRTDFYTLYIYVPKNGAGWYYKVVDESDGTTATGLVTTDLLASSSFVRPFNYTSVGGVSAQTGIGIFTIYRLIP